MPEGQSLLVCALSYALKFGMGKEFKILLVKIENFEAGDFSLPKQEVGLLEAMSSLNIEYISFDESRRTEFDTVYLLPACHLYASTLSFLANFSFNSIGLFADGLRNDLTLMSLDLKKDQEEKLIFFGFSGDFNRLRRINRMNSNIEIVELEYLSSVWNQINTKCDYEKLPEFNESDLFVALRYWGDHPYAYKSDMTTNKILMRLISQVPNLKRVIVKETPMSHKRSDFNYSELLVECNKNGIDVINWDDLFQGSLFDKIHQNPEGLFFQGQLAGLGHFFGFDSTLNVIAKLYAPNTKVYLPEVLSDLEIFLERLLSGENLDEVFFLLNK